MKKENEYSQLLKNMLKVYKKYTGAFNEESRMYLFMKMPAPDKSAQIGIRKINGKIEYFFGGNYFSNNPSPFKPSIKKIYSQLKRLNVNSYGPIEDFKSNFTKQLREHLAKEISKDLENILL